MSKTPLPIVSGRYFFPKAPLLCLKRMPAVALTSVYSIGPDGRGGVGVGVGLAATTSLGVALSTGAVADGCLHADRTSMATSTRWKVISFRRIKISLSFLRFAACGRNDPLNHTKQHEELFVSFRVTSWIVFYALFCLHGRENYFAMLCSRLDSSHISISMAVGPTRNNAYSGA